MSEPKGQREVVVIDSGGANLASVRFALERLQWNPVVSTDPAQIRAAERVILPGVGAASDVMARLRSGGLDQVVASLTQPVLGICVGLQVLYQHCAEGQVDGLGLLDGVVEHLPSAPQLSVPQMGWNRIAALADHALFDGLDLTEAHFYFVHSYAAAPGAQTLATASYGNTFTAVAGCRNLLATQFHPERSARWGHRLLKNFLTTPPENLLCE
ncbi:MAG: imidazole glycerol phosphate synthase subunit HisH [Pseudomonadota bacterium]